jgi:hypothetical protein
LAAVEQKDIKAADEQDEAERALIASLPKSHEKRVISFGLYGNNTKYTHGAVKNSELAQVEKEVDLAPLLTLPLLSSPIRSISLGGCVASMSQTMSRTRSSTLFARMAPRSNLSPPVPPLFRLSSLALSQAKAMQRGCSIGS